MESFLGFRSILGKLVGVDEAKLRRAWCKPKQLVVVVVYILEGIKKMFNVGDSVKYVGHNGKISSGVGVVERKLNDGRLVVGVTTFSKDGDKHIESYVAKPESLAVCL